MYNWLREWGISFVLYNQIKNIIIFLLGCGAMWLFIKAKHLFKLYKFAFNDLGTTKQMALQTIKDKENREHLITILNSEKHAYLPVFFRLFLHHMKHGDAKPKSFMIKYSKVLQMQHYLYLVASILVILFTLYLIFVIQDGG